MSTETQGTTDSSNNEATTTATETPDIDSIVAAKVEESLKEIKSKLDSAYSARDAAHKKLAEIERKDREASLKALEEAGKWKEASEVRLTEEQAKRNELQAQFEELQRVNLELTRDAKIRDAMRTVQFRNSKAEAMAFKDIAAELIRDEKGNWVHKTGVSIEDFVKAFTEDEANGFLVIPKTSTGGGTQQIAGKSSSSSPSLFQRKQSEVLKMAAEGKLSK